MSDTKHDIARSAGAAAMKASWPVGVTLWTWLGQNLPTIVALATLIYLIAQIWHLLWKWGREGRGS